MPGLMPRHTYDKLPPEVKEAVSEIEQQRQLNLDPKSVRYSRKIYTTYLNTSPFPLGSQEDRDLWHFFYGR